MVQTLTLLLIHQFPHLVTEILWKLFKINHPVLQTNTITQTRTILLEIRLPYAPHGSLQNPLL